MLKASVTLRILDTRDSMFLLEEAAIVPLRVDRQGTVYCIYKSDGYLMYALPDGGLCIFEQDIRVNTESLSIPKHPVPLSAVTQILDPILTSEDLLATSVAFQNDQYGIYVFYKGPEIILLEIIEYFDQKTTMRLMAWEEGSFDTSEGSFTSKLKFSPFANLSQIQSQITRLINNISITQILIDSQNSRVNPQQSLTGPAGRENNQGDETLEGKSDSLASEKYSSKRVTPEHKMLRQTLQYGFPNLAIHPDSVATIIDKVVNAKATIEALHKLDRSEDVPMKKIHGNAGKIGWRELSQHLSTGTDNRGRIYTRKVLGKAHRLDIYVDWKADKKSQEKTLNLLSSLSTFEHNNIISR